MNFRFLSGASSNDDNGDGGIKNFGRFKNLSVLPPFVSHSIWQKTERLKENKLFASAVKLLPPSINPSALSLCPCLGLCCTVGGQQGALLGRLAQLYLLLDDPSRVVDERVDQTGHCGRTSRREKTQNTSQISLASSTVTFYYMTRWRRGTHLWTHLR